MPSAGFFTIEPEPQRPRCHGAEARLLAKEASTFLPSQPVPEEAQHGLALKAAKVSPSL